MKLGKAFFIQFAVIIILSLGCNAWSTEYEYFSILAETMNPVDSTIEYDCDEGYLETTSDSTLHATQYIGQINLTHGAVFDTVSAYGYDTDSEDFTFQVFRYRFNGEGNNVFEQVSKIGDSSVIDPGGYVDITVGSVFPVDPPGLTTVNNQNYSYGLYLTLPAAASDELYVVRFVIRAKLPESQSSSTRAVVIPMFD
jgi:hypothetical protein